MKHIALISAIIATNIFHATNPGSIAITNPPAPIGGLYELGANEFWIASYSGPAVTNVFGTGWEQDPFYGNFDAILRVLPAPCIAHLANGTFLTQGNIQLHHGQRIIGYGEDQTVVKLDLSSGTNYSSAIFLGYEDGNEISGLTLDAGSDDSEFWVRAGTELYGRRNLVDRVHVINTSGNYTMGWECFPIFLGGIGDQSTAHNIISHCLVDQCRGDYTTAIALNGNGSINECQVTLPPITNSTMIFNAYQTSGSLNAHIYGCTSTGGNCGYYSDTFSETNLDIDGCDFANCGSGVFISKWSGGAERVTVRYTNVELATNGLYGIAFSGVGPFKSILVDGCRIKYATGNSNRAPGLSIAVTSSNATDVIITSCSWSAGMKFLLYSTNNTTIGNSTLPQ